jgi:hypothetical protein
VEVGGLRFEADMGKVNQRPSLKNKVKARRLEWWLK